MSLDDRQNLSPLKRALIEIRELRARVASADRQQREPMAVIGMGMRYPGDVHDSESFWQLMWDGGDAITEVPAQRWSAEALYDPDPDAAGRMTTRHGGFLPGIDGFDAAFFGISPREAETMDPQQRLLLEVTWEAFEHAGMSADRLFGSNTGVFLGIGNSDHFRMLLADPERIDTYTTTGNALSIAAGRLSYFLGIQGPAVAVDTACSSSLVAVHLAAQALRSGECDLAIAGGVNLILSPELTINFSKARMMSADGRCKTFDASADGYVRSEGCGMVVLKRLADAQRDGDRVLAVVRGSAVNQDGRSGGLTAPNGPSQERVIASALAAAGTPAAAIGYVEAHGTGTLLGDPIEVRALGSVLGASRSATDPLLIGSVKTNIGHTETAAGVAGLIKLVLMLQHGAIPPHLHLTELNPHIATEHLPIAVPTERTVWPSRDGGRVGGVSSFGLSGTNAHVVVGEAPAERATDRTGTSTTEQADRSRHLLALSAKTPGALAQLVRLHAARFAADPGLELADVAFSANTGRSHFDHRLAVVAEDAQDASDKLHAFLTGRDEAVATGVVAGGAPDVVFLFTGHGSHHAGMGRQLYSEQPVFKDAIDRCGALLRDQMDLPLTTVLFGDGGHLDDMVHAQPALFSLQYALAELWQSWGVVPTVVAGHSAGEYVAAVIAGVLSLADGLRLISVRGRLLASLAGDGEMVAVFASEADVAAAIGLRTDVGIAAVNGPTTTVISGRAASVRAVIDDLALDDDEIRPLDIPTAAHSPLIDPVLDEFDRTVRSATLGRPQITLVSSMTGTDVDAELTTTDYWRRHLREPVRFADVFSRLHAMGCTTFVEIGPHPTLIGLGQRCWPDTDATWAPSMRRDTDESEQIATSLSVIYAAGVDIDWQAFDSPFRRTRVPVPTYPWQRESYWSPLATPNGRPAPKAEWPAATAAAQAQAEQGPLDLRVERYEQCWSLLDRLASAYITEAVRNLALFPTSGTGVTVRDLIDEGRIGTAYEHLLQRWFENLAEASVIEQMDPITFAAPHGLVGTDIRALLADAIVPFEGIETLLDYVCRCGGRLAEIVSGREDALPTLFPNGSYETVDFLYSLWSVPRYFNGIVRAAVAAASNARAGRSLRVIEVGAGTGGTTAAVVADLPPDRTMYTFTDVSDFFLARAGERFARHSFLQYSRLDIEQTPSDQGYVAGTYDIVIAANVLHATRHLDRTLANVRSLLAPGGLLIAYEGTRHPRWFDITTGLIEGWQLFEDDWRTDQPLLPVDEWTSALLAAGFVETVALPRAEAPTAILGQHVFLARGPGESTSVHSAADRPAGTHAPSLRPAQISAPDGASISTALADALPDEREDLLVGFVREAIAYVLRVGDASRLRRDQPLIDLGFDSLMAVELRNVLREGLGLERKLPATLVFDHPSILAIASHLDTVMFADRRELGRGADPAGDSNRFHAAVGRDSRGATDLTDFTEDEVEAMLMQKLSEITER